MVAGFVFERGNMKKMWEWEKTTPRRVMPCMKHQEAATPVVVLGFVCTPEAEYQPMRA